MAVHGGPAINGAIWLPDARYIRPRGGLGATRSPGGAEEGEAAAPETCHWGPARGAHPASSPGQTRPKEPLLGHEGQQELEGGARHPLHGPPSSLPGWDEDPLLLPHVEPNVQCLTQRFVRSARVTQVQFIGAPQPGHEPPALPDRPGF
ncbi:hypothetical protein NDU88_000855 [Pleurodeles waltl]|uniref:Uncharacterized protein n=1 Tax=Pleurodeles waltl TaxID=8319 RepID=A0AAV7U4N3_PLEWA|nr:hypothetical protein NDU88_000855 [Pleurodeles waltl]